DALAYPSRMPSGNPRIDFSLKQVLELEPAVINDHPCLKLSWEAMNKGGNMPCVLNAANEEAVAAFLSGQISFTSIPNVISHCMEQQPFIEKADLPCIFETDRASREAARQMIKTIRR
ncbi:MAG: 1-deoxy-D-xylulose-5-phosphate reductoisomerase, partial [Bacteroidales bacterium]|nr:1-deoxy-D-xylulose-5-phosphate reductoisomerase [Bacteroidales bacterium]